MRTTYEQQQWAITTAIQNLQNDLMQNSNYNAVIKNDINDQIIALKDAMKNIQRLEQLSQILREI